MKATTTKAKTNTVLNVRNSFLTFNVINQALMTVAIPKPIIEIIAASFMFFSSRFVQVFCTLTAHIVPKDTVIVNN